MRVVDVLRNMAAVIDTHPALKEHAESAVILRKIAGQAVVLDAANVAEWYDAHVPQSSDPDRLRMFERCVPPFAVTAVEYPTHDGSDLPHRMVLVWRNDVLVEQKDVGYYLLWFEVWRSNRRNLAISASPLAQLQVSLDGVPDWSTFDLREKEGYPDHLPESDVIEAASRALLAFRFSHARNVSMVDHPAPRHERRQALREGKPAPVSYKTLEIGPIARVMEQEGRVGEVGLAKAFHLCRGHFADYTKGAGLFGKYKVEVFVPEHFKGRKERGVIDKDYRVLASRASAIAASESDSPEAVP